MTRAIIALFLLISGCFPASAFMPALRTVMQAPLANTYYVSTSGSASNVGKSATSAWSTVAKVNAGVFRAFDRILFQGGKNFNTATGIVMVAANWSTKSPPSNSIPVTFGSFGSGRATVTTTATGQLGFESTSLDGVTVRDLIFVGPNSASVADAGVEIYNGSATIQHYGVYLANLDISAFNTGFDIEAFPNLVKGYTNLTVNGANIHAQSNLAGGVGMFISGNGNSASYSQNNYLIQGITVTGAVGDGIDVRGVNGFTMQNSHLTTSVGSTNNTGGLEIEESNNGLIQYNEIDHWAASLNSVDADGLDFDFGTTNTTAQYNYIHDNAGAGITLFQSSAGALGWSGNTLRYNITQNNGVGPSNVLAELFIGAASQTAMTGLQVYNNTFYASHGAANVNAIVAFGAANITGQISNNIFQGSANPRSIDAVTFNPTTTTFTGNDYFGTVAFRWNNVAYSSFATWQTATSQEKISGSNVGLTSTPSLTSAGSGGTTGGYAPASLTAYQLAHGSAMIGAGINLATQYSITQPPTDYYMDAVPNGGAGTGYNVGADGANR